MTYQLVGFRLLFGPEYDALAPQFGLQPSDPPYGRYAAVVLNRPLKAGDHSCLKLAAVAPTPQGYTLTVLGEVSPTVLTTLDGFKPSAMYIRYPAQLCPPKTITGTYTNINYDSKTDTYTVELTP